MVLLLERSPQKSHILTPAENGVFAGSFFVRCIFGVGGLERKVIAGTVIAAAWGAGSSQIAIVKPGFSNDEVVGGLVPGILSLRNSEVGDQGVLNCTRLAMLHSPEERGEAALHGILEVEHRVGDFVEEVVCLGESIQVSLFL